jgi:hypothetical protein
VAVVHVVRIDGPDYLLDADRPVVVDTGLLGTLQIFVAAILYPEQGRLVVVKTYGADGTCGVARLAGLGAGSILAQQTAVGFFIDIHFSVGW